MNMKDKGVTWEIVEPWLRINFNRIKIKYQVPKKEYNKWVSEVKLIFKEMGWIEFNVFKRMVYSKENAWKKQ